MFEYFFGKKKTPQEQLREHQRLLNRSIRELDRERLKLEQQEKKTVSEIQQLAKKGGQANSGAIRVMAKDLVRTRNHVKKFYSMRTSLQGCLLRVTAVSSNAAMGQSLMGATKAMRAMNNGMNLPALQKILREFEIQSETMDMKEAIMDDTIDDAFSEDEDEEAETVVQQVLDEIGINVDHLLASNTTPNSLGLSSNANPASVAADSEPVANGIPMSADQLLQDRLNNLRRD
ncbi:Charged multivesicular body protein 2a [Smittium culicis]|uniref:Charged multivesicular body protein 2a n=1 Tax=Smittium culicis TaxID=133412 RepID=A0A1R1XRY0_9FUNG|nr:Charged multivesicular body protein 2a [Smittium culicis]OMJ17413.1 Charged multivesicular body protein 2a [Smittium culicis]